MQQIQLTDTYGSLWINNGSRNILHDIILHKDNYMSIYKYDILNISRYKAIITSPYLDSYSTSMIISQKYNIPLMVNINLCPLKEKVVETQIPYKLKVETKEEFIDRWRTLYNEISIEYPSCIFVTHKSVLDTIVKIIDIEIGNLNFDVYGSDYIFGVST
jgi:hypothetical protein